ncbi:MAG: hypothetical protein COW00_13960 [Bdellovibrio sp. CG12_big_fil_rev_8_21_14_0_65_39_13]|nr:MAG: hypothetical protein COW78_07385 [Bdellovibrio sp. CG22_combo_CG10-13_8_21_14_all_39_27]PIQ58719.1 MAG: hypothetical protein COW00_13960 [Bdellovibrio sp. CG12_big_fil_rev_8_21_14_0_65_39_13]PIR33094.1 MAG: hypothetical protein COV37_18555 [Bdellovibrio sp. CG11_big_fil_rev_8_21_14_0_20_39_38]
MSARLIVFTGKGGVGKTTLSLAQTLSLKESGKNVLYNNFDQFPNYGLCDRLRIPHLDLELEESAVEYMAQKLGSHMIAGWIMKTPFFSSLLHMLPGLGHIIIMGHLINRLEKDPTLTIVMDSPSSGHAMTMFESTHNFKKIFGSGMLFNDLNRMQDFLFSGDKVSVNVVTLPTEMAIHEASELKSAFLGFGLQDVKIVMNESLPSIPEMTPERVALLPEFLSKKYQIESQIIESFKSEITNTFPHLVNESMAESITELAKYFGGSK